MFYFKIAVNSVLGLEEGKECIIVGTLYKHMKLKPSVLDEYSKEVLCDNNSKFAKALLVTIAEEVSPFIIIFFSQPVLKLSNNFITKCRLYCNTRVWSDVITE